MAVIPWFDQLYIRRGLIVASGQVFQEAIEPGDLLAESTGQRTTLRMISISSSRELTESLGLDASATYLGTGWGVSGEFELTKTREINNYYTYALIKVMVTNPPEIIRNPRLKTEALELFQNQGWDAFVRKYGIEYVEGRVTGGTYYALIEIQTTNQKDQVNTRSKLSGFYGTFKASAELKTAFQEVVNNIGYSVYVIKSGGDGVQQIGIQELIDHALQFPKEALEKPVIVTAFTAKYESLLPAIPDPNALIRKRQRDTLEDLNIAYLRLRDRKANLEFVLSHFNQFDEFRDLDPEQLNQKRMEYKSSLEAVVAQIDIVTKRHTACISDMNQCEAYAFSLPSLDLPTIGGELMDLKQLEERVNQQQLRLESLQSGIENGSIIAQKAVMLQARDNWHWMRHHTVDPLNRDVFELWRGDNTWHQTIATDSANSALTIGWSEEFRWSSGNPPVKMWHSSRSAAFLARVSGDFRGGGEYVQIFVGGDGYWYLGGDAQTEQGVDAIARCIGTP